jgi:DsbC/DsbD-like thiol-disulfide interchange protein
LNDILILGAGSVNQASRRLLSQAIQWFALPLGCKDGLMTVIVPARAALGLAATVLASSLAIEARAQDASPWQRDGHSAVRLLAGSRSGPVLLGGIAFQLQQGWKTYWRTPGDSGVPPRFDFSKSENIEAVTILWPAPTKFDDGAGGHSLGYHNQIVLPLRIVAKNADKPVTLRADVSYAVCDKLCIPVEANAELAFTSVASTEDGALSSALDTVPKPANVGDPNPLTIRDVKREGKTTVLVDVSSPDAREVSLFVEGPTPDWGLPVPNLLERGPPGVKRFAFELDGLPPGAHPEGAALKLTLVGGDRAYEFNINLD